MNVQELRKKSSQELQETLKELLREHFSLRTQKSIEQTVRPHSFGQVRRNIARIKTLINEKRRKGDE